MPQKPRAAGCMLNTLSTNLTHQYRGLWITDAILAETFHKFTHSSQRYGSSVPGPLEARRRASKRRNASLANINSTGPAIYEPAVMLGSGSKDRWWKKVENVPATTGGWLDGLNTGTRIDEVAPSLLPSWLAKSPIVSADMVEDLQLRGQPGEIIDKPRNDRLSTDANREFRTRMERTTNLSAVRQVMESMQINLWKSPELTSFVFDHLMKIYGRPGRYTKLVHVLSDPLFNPPGSNNHLIFVKHIRTAHVSRKMWEVVVYPALLHAIELGLVPTHDLQEIISLVRVIRQEMSTTCNQNKTYAEWHGILTAIDQSRVLRLEDLDSGFLSSWYRLIADSPRNDTSFLLLWRLRRYSGLSQMELGTELMIARLRDYINTNEEFSGKLTEWLASLAPELQGALIIQVTFKLLAAAQYQEDAATHMLEQWSNMLPLMDLEALDLPITQSTWSQASIIDNDLTHSQQLLTVIWIITRLRTQNSCAMTRIVCEDLRDEFVRTFTSMDGVDRFDHLSRIVLTLDTLPLPNKNEIFSFLQHFSGESLIKMLGNDQYSDSLKAYLRLEYAELRDDAVHYTAKQHFPDILRALAESINTDLAQFKAMAQTLILKSSKNIRIVRHLLNHNMELKFAAMQSWPSTRAKRDVGNVHTNLDPEAVLDMLEQLTMTIAVAPAASPKSAFTHVHRMYSFLHKIGAPTNPIIGRALWHAGVTRYAQTGAPREQVLWCMSKVREMEGHDAAKRLLWSAGFRKQFVNEFIHSLKSDILGSPLELTPDTKGSLHVADPTRHRTPTSHRVLFLESAAGSMESRKTGPPTVVSTKKTPLVDSTCFDKRSGSRGAART